LERKNVSELAQELGISPLLLLYHWRKEFRENGETGFPGNRVQFLSDVEKRIAEFEI